MFGVSQVTIPSRFLREMPSERIEKYDRSDDGQAGADGSGATDRDALMDERFAESNSQAELPQSSAKLKGGSSLSSTSVNPIDHSW